MEEIDTMYIQNVLPWKSSKWVAPPPDEIARIRAEAGTMEAVDTEIGTTRNDGEIEPAQKESLDSSEASEGEKAAEREAGIAREEMEARERAQAEGRV